MPDREYSRGGINLCPCPSWRWKPGERYIDDAVEIYAKVYPNLLVHDRNYPTPDFLRSKIRVGNVEFEGDTSKDTPGSDLIKTVLLDDEPGPVYLLAWGGQSTIARALKSIRQQYEASPEWPKLLEKVSRKAIIQAFGDQDGTNASYIKPDRFCYEVSPSPGVSGTIRIQKAETTIIGPSGAQYNTSNEPFSSGTMVHGGLFGCPTVFSDPDVWPVRWRPRIA